MRYLIFFKNLVKMKKENVCVNKSFGPGLRIVSTKKPMTIGGDV